MGKMRNFSLALILAGLMVATVPAVLAENEVTPQIATAPQPGWSTSLNHIERVQKAGLMSGYPDGQFHPEGKLTRAELAHILVKAFDVDKRFPLNPGAAAPSDVPQSHWAYGDIMTAISRDVMEGYRAQRFYPNQAVTRGEAFAIIAQAYGVFQFPNETVDEVLANYRDAHKLPDWSKKALATALHEGFVNTDERAGYIHPELPMTRGDMAYALSKYLERISGPGLYKK
jgi:hypothetical protein